MELRDLQVVEARNHFQVNLGEGRAAEEMAAQDGRWSSSVRGTGKDQQEMLFCLEGEMGSYGPVGDNKGGGRGIWDRMSGKGNIRTDIRGFTNSPKWRLRTRFNLNFINNKTNISYTECPGAIHIVTLLTPL